MDNWDRATIEDKIRTNEASIQDLVAKIEENERTLSSDLTEKTKAIGRKLLAFQRLQLDEKLKLRSLYDQALHELSD